jgi:hypothetical protein
MSINLLITQLPYVGHISQAEMSHPEVMQAVSRERALEDLKRAREQVQKTDRDEAASSVDKDGGQERRQMARQHQHEAGSEEGEEAAEQQANPWAGNIVNVTI